MYALLILPILVSGFIVCKYHPKVYFRLHRYEGQFLYLQSAYLGSICVTISFMILATLRVCTPRYLNLFSFRFEFSPITYFTTSLQAAVNMPKAQESEALTLVWLMALTLAAIVIAYLWSFGAVLWMKVKDLLICFGESQFSPTKIALMWNILRDSPLDIILMRSLVQTRHVMITLDSDKVYVGIINNLGEPNEREGPSQEISLVPILSGYRDANTKDVKFSNYYDFADNVSNDFSVVIPQSRIVTVSWFDFDTYERLHGGQPSAVEAGIVTVL